MVLVAVSMTGLVLRPYQWLFVTLFLFLLGSDRRQLLDGLALVVVS